MNSIVIALGGNALQTAKGPATAEAQLDVVRETTRHLAGIVKAGHRLVIVHGNGPQVGRLVLQSEAAKEVTPALPFDVLGAMSQGLIGYHIQQALKQALTDEGLDTPVATVLTQVVVDSKDPGFQKPTKPIGPYYTKDEADAIVAEKGYTFKEDAGRGYRRVVASPLPLEVVELSAVKTLSDNGFVPVTCGGGGIPVARDDKGALYGVAAVIDKDLAAALLADKLGADKLIILTAVSKVCIHFNTPEQQALDHMTVDEARRYQAEGHFAAGSMGPKVDAALRFVTGAPGRQAVIASLEEAEAALRGEAGTVIAS